MAYTSVKLHSQAIRLPLQHPSPPFSLCKTFFQPLSVPSNNLHYSHLYFLPWKLLETQRLPSISIHASLSSDSSPTPPTSKEEAILQAKTCLSSTLQKPLNNPKLTGKLKKQKQPRFRVEIPVVDDSPASITQLAFNIFGDLPVKRKGSPVKILFIWPNPTLKEGAVEAFGSTSLNMIDHVDLATVMTVDNRNLNSADVAVFLAPEASQLNVVRVFSGGFYPKPLVLFNPKWGFEEESGFNELSSFVGSFDVVYAFLGLEVRGILSKRNGVLFKCVRDGVLSGEKWNVLVEEEGTLKVVSRFKSRPSIVEVETVLYNLMAVNSPITKSAKILRNLVSNVTGRN
ncbi:hypothetical protein Ancab_025210 [Ancistrocladus abbreviatus]